MPIKCSRSTCPDAAPKLQCQSGRPALGSSRPSCEPQQARGIPRNLQLDEKAGIRYGVIWRIPELVGESSAKFGISWRVAAWPRLAPTAVLISCRCWSMGVVIPRYCREAHRRGLSPVAEIGASTAERSKLVAACAPQRTEVNVNVSAADPTAIIAGAGRKLLALIAERQT